MKLLHILSTPRESSSNTLRISNAFLEELHKKYPDLTVKVIDMFDKDLPAVAGDNIEAKYQLMSGLQIDQHQKESWEQIEKLIEQFLAHDIYLITTPMWNFNIPYVLKYYIDCIVQPGYLFRYNELGQAVGMVTDKKMVCITSRGGDYSEGSAFHVYDFQEPYLRAIFGFCGITDIAFVHAQPMDITVDIREAAIQKSIEEARIMAQNFEWSPIKAIPVTENPIGLKPLKID